MICLIYITKTGAKCDEKVEPFSFQLIKTVYLQFKEKSLVIVKELTFYQLYFVKLIFLPSLSNGNLTMVLSPGNSSSKATTSSTYL